LRELYEETNIRSVEVLRTSEPWFVYDLPKELIGVAWKGKYRGQKMKWTLARFTGLETEINVTNPAGGHKPEFAKWKWLEPAKSMDKVVPFKQQLYKDVFAYFAHDMK
jgi:putative (di)nucleoside polyphosphate hydrolase